MDLYTRYSAAAGANLHLWNVAAACLLAAGVILLLIGLCHFRDTRWPSCDR